jgi:transcription elongation factor GreA|tara:strand:- start:6082 stop:6879 length:798 start_codon:yes stop_codon:yes gene_type:complete
MRKSRKETIKNDLSSFIQWLTESLENKSYDKNDNLENINLNIIEPFFIEQYVQITNLKHSNQNASKKLSVARDYLNYIHNEGFTEANLGNHIRNKKGRRSGSVSLKSKIHEGDIVEISQEYHNSLEKELTVKYKEREDVVVDINKAAADKDFRENAPLEAAREKQGLIESQIKTIEETLRKSVIINAKKSTKKNKIAQIGSKVTLEKENKRTKINLVASPEADVNLSKISLESPLGKAIIGKGENEPVIVSAPAGEVHYKIIKIT